MYKNMQFAVRLSFALVFEKSIRQKRFQAASPLRKRLTDLLRVLCSLNMTYGQEPNIIRCVI